MKLRIIDYSWGIDRRDGTHHEAKVAEEVFDLDKVGPLPPIGPAKKVFEVKEIKEGEARIFLSERSGEVTLELGKPYIFRPTSFDGGHYYDLVLE